MRHLIKSVIIYVLGRKLAYKWRRAFRRPAKVFSEIDLIEEYFSERKLPGFMLDIGAHHGESLEAYQNWNWRILAFEPDPANRVVLESRADSRLVMILPFAVGDREEEGVPFYASSESDGISSLSAFRDTHRVSTKVRVTSLAKVISEKQITRVDYLKIDTEGHDLFVLKGYPWDRMTPEVVTCEFEDSKTVPLGYNYRDMGDYLVANGYKVFLSEWAPIERYGAAHTWRSWRAYPCDLKDPTGWGNYVAFRPDCDLGRVQSYLRRFTIC